MFPTDTIECLQNRKLVDCCVRRCTPISAGFFRTIKIDQLRMKHRKFILLRFIIPYGLHLIKHTINKNQIELE